MRTRYMPAVLLVTAPAAARLRPLVDPPASAATARARGVEVYPINDRPSGPIGPTTYARHWSSKHRSGRSWLPAAATPMIIAPTR